MSDGGGNKRFYHISFTSERAFAHRGCFVVEKGDLKNINGVKLITLVELSNT